MVADVSEQAVHDEGSEIPPGLNGLSSIDARRLLGEVGPNRWVKQDRFAPVREVVSLLLDPMAVMLILCEVLGGVARVDAPAVCRFDEENIGVRDQLGVTKNRATPATEIA